MAYRNLLVCTLLACVAGHGANLHATSWKKMIKELQGGADDLCRKFNEGVAYEARKKGIVNPKPARCGENLLRIVGVMAVKELQRAGANDELMANLADLERDIKRLPDTRSDEQAAEIAHLRQRLNELTAAAHGEDLSSAGVKTQDHEDSVADLQHDLEEVVAKVEAMAVEPEVLATEVSETSEITDRLVMPALPVASESSSVDYEDWCEISEAT